MSEQAVAGRPQVYPVDFVLANNSSMGNDRYCLDLTDEQLRVMLRDDDSPRWVRIPDRYHAQNGNNEARYLSLANVVELHIGGGWQPPAEWEWGGLLKHLKALVVERASE